MSFRHPVRIPAGERCSPGRLRRVRQDRWSHHSFTKSVAETYGRRVMLPIIAFARRAKVPWKECNPMDERLKFIAQLLGGGEDRGGVLQVRHLPQGLTRYNAIGLMGSPIARAGRIVRSRSRRRSRASSRTSRAGAHGRSESLFL
jgi:hypothetical protein